MDRKSEREALIRSHFHAIETTHAVDATLSAFSRPRYEVFPLGIVADGREAASAFLTGLYAAFPDFRIEAEHFHHGEDTVVVEGKTHGTHNGFWLHIPPTGKEVVVPVAMIYQFEGSDLVAEKVYFDHATVLKQIGAM